MKKIVTAMIAGMMVCSAINAQSLKIVNTFGGDSDSTGGSDLFSFEKQKDEDGNLKNEFTNTTRVSDRLQMDASDKYFDARVRMEVATTKLNGKESTMRLRGYGRFKPVDQLNIIAGNDFSTKVPVNAGYMAASDDYAKNARLLQNGFGAVSNWAFGDEKNITMNLAGGVKGTDGSFSNKDKLGLDFGFNFAVKNLVSFGGSFQNVIGNQFTAGVFAGLKAVENLTLNAGYIYNDTDTDYLPKAAKNVLMITAGYNLKEAGLFAGADVISGLEGDSIPLQTNVRLTYKVNDSLTAGVKAKVSTILGSESALKADVYPNLTYNLQNKMGSVTTGVRVSADKNGVIKFAVPFSWKCTIAEIKK